MEDRGMCHSNTCAGPFRRESFGVNEIGLTCPELSVYRFFVGFGLPGSLASRTGSASGCLSSRCARAALRYGS